MLSVRLHDEYEVVFAFLIEDHNNGARNVFKVKRGTRVKCSKIDNDTINLLFINDPFEGKCSIKELVVLNSSLNAYFKKIDNPPPKNNDGRIVCWWCGNQTKKVSAITNVYDVCSGCGR